MGATEERLEPSALKEGMEGCQGLLWEPWGVPGGSKLLSGMLMMGSALGNPFICSQIFCVPPWRPAVSPDCLRGSAKAWSGASVVPLCALLGDGNGTSRAAKSGCPFPRALLCPHWVLLLALE